MSATKEKHCSSCGKVFGCGVDSGETPCWCFDYPFVYDLESAEDCVCPDCFKTHCTLKIEEYVATVTPEIAQNNMAKELPKTNKLINGIDYNMENGNCVFKPWFHLKRCHCCANNCRHCPYKLKKN
jgi:hypothetical protein